MCVLAENWRQAATKRALAPGHVELNAGEGGLPKASVVSVSQLFTVDKNQLEGCIGILSAQRVCQILDWMVLILCLSGVALTVNFAAVQHKATRAASGMRSAQKLIAILEAQGVKRTAIEKSFKETGVRITA